MPEQDDKRTENQPEDKTGAPDTTNAPETQDDQTKAVADWEEEATKWKRFSRQNEDAKKALEKRLADLEAVTMSDAEKAIASAKAEGRKETLSEVGVRLAKAELRVAAADAGVSIPQSLDAYVDFSRMLDDEGNPNNEAITDFVSSLKPKKAANEYSQKLGIGPQGDGSSVIDYSPEAIAKRVMERDPYRT